MLVCLSDQHFSGRFSALFHSSFASVCFVFVLYYDELKYSVPRAYIMYEKVYLSISSYIQ